MVFLIHTELRCTVNHTSDLRLYLFCSIFATTQDYTASQQSRSFYTMRNVVYTEIYGSYCDGCVCRKFNYRVFRPQCDTATMVPTCMVTLIAWYTLSYGQTKGWRWFKRQWSWSIFKRWQVRIFIQTPAILTDNSRSFSQYVQIYSRVVPHVIPILLLPMVLTTSY